MVDLTFEFRVNTYWNKKKYKQIYVKSAEYIFLQNNSFSLLYLIKQMSNTAARRSTG